MLFQFQCKDNQSNAQTLRQEKLIEHLAWVEDNMASIKVAGPLIEIKTSTYTGSMYVISANNQQDAENILSKDPYYQANVWQSVACFEFKDYAGQWVGGKNWPGSSSV